LGCFALRDVAEQNGHLPVFGLADREGVDAEPAAQGRVVVVEARRRAPPADIAVDLVRGFIQPRRCLAQAAAEDLAREADVMIEGLVGLDAAVET
jgi:hypothetical protein